MICMYKLVKNVIKFIDEKENEEKMPKTQQEPMNFFLNSMSDETYLDMIREYIQFLIDEDYKYSEQLEIINNKSARNIKYNTYTNFVKRFILENPKNLFQDRESRFYKIDNRYHQNIESNQEERNNNTSTIERESKVLYSDNEKSNKSKKQEISTRQKPVEKSISEIEKTSPVAPLRKKPLDSKPRENVSFKHEAMPNVDELY